MSKGFYGGDEDWNKQADWLKLIADLEQLHSEFYISGQYHKCVPVLRQWLIKLSGRKTEGTTPIFEATWVKIDEAEALIQLLSKNSVDIVQKQYMVQQRNDLFRTINEIQVALEQLNQMLNVNNSVKKDKTRAFINGRGQ